MDQYGNIDSKYRFVILAAKRAKQLLRGAKPKIRPKTKNLIRIAQAEVRSGLIEFELLPSGKGEASEKEEPVFLGEGAAEDAPDIEDSADKLPVEDEPEEEEEEDEEESEDEEEPEDAEDDLKEDKD